MLPFKSPQKPRLTREEAFTDYITPKMKIELEDDKIFILGVRDYYLKTVRDKGYRCALFIVTRDGFYPFRATTRPFNPKPDRKVKGKEILGTARLKLGLHKAHIKDEHCGASGNCYPALCHRVGVLPVMRLGRGGVWYESTSERGINFHHGGDTNSTHSDGCQTVPKSEWNEFYSIIKANVKEGEIVPYLLVGRK